ncbi:hypothetical protein [Nevskia sp.]|nr:hypothetical protein [Nevskia sp.]
MFERAFSWVADLTKISQFNDLTSIPQALATRPAGSIEGLSGGR